MRNAGLVCAMLAPLFGCNVGDGGDGGGGGGNLIPPGGSEPVMLCEASLTVSGTLTPAGAEPGPDDGCVPEGTWTLNVAVDDDGGCPSVPINATYTYEVTRDADEVLVVTYLGSDSGPDDYLKPGSAGGTCRLNLNHYGPDGNGAEVVLLQAFENDLTVTGSGTYELWDE